MAKARQIVFSRMQRVVWGWPASEVVVEEAVRLAARRAFLIVSRTLYVSKIWADGGYGGAKLAGIPDARDLEIVPKPEGQQGFVVLLHRRTAQEVASEFWYGQFQLAADRSPGGAGAYRRFRRLVEGRSFATIKGRLP
ncbi:MAG: hypothetical protein OXE76_12085 [Alphaproteobacteria bacterium]|nr:hypothetical protein [Alphaproteobacteria bacterium]